MIKIAGSSASIQLWDTLTAKRVELPDMKDTKKPPSVKNPNTSAKPARAARDAANKRTRLFWLFMRGSWRRDGGSEPTDKRASW